MINRFNKFKKAALLGAATFVVSLGAALGFGVQATFAGDCSTNAILKCGAVSRTDFISKVKANTQGDLPTIYNAYGLSTSDYSRFASSARNGLAYKDGRIVVDGRTVATDSKSLGRDPKPYSHPVTIGGKTYHESRAQDVYLSDSIPVMVLFDTKGRVETVVMNDCGNPIHNNPENPSYSCNYLYKEYAGTRGSYDFSTSTTTHNGAKVVKVVYDFGDGSATVTKSNPAEKVRHAYKAGTYKAKVTLYVSVPFGETQVVAPAGNCVRDVTVDEEKNPGISIDKTAEGAEHVFKDHVIVGAGNEFRYKLVVKNTGNVDLKNAVVKDTAPTGINLLSATHGSITNNVWSYTIPSLKIGQSLTIYITAMAPKEFAGEVKNTACVDTPEVTGNPDDCDDAWVSTHHRAVSINKVVNGKEKETVEVGKPFTYTLAVKNEGDVALKDVKVTDPAPANVQFLSADKGTIVANKWTYVIPELKVGETMTFNITAKLTKYVEDSIKNTACVDAPIITGNPDDCDDATIDTPKAVVSCYLLTVTGKNNVFTFKTDYTVENATFVRIIYVVRDAAGNELYRGENSTYAQSKPGAYSVQAHVVASVGGETKTVTDAVKCKKTFTVETPAAPGVSIDKKVDGVESKQVAVGQNFVYQLVVKNTGNVTLKNVVVSDPAPANVQFLSADKGTITANKWTYTIPELKVGESMTFAITAKVTAQVTGNIVNTACVNAPEVNPSNPTQTDDCDEAQVNVPPVVVKNPNITITKTVNGQEAVQVAVGENFTYKLVVKNTGEVDMKNVVVTDRAPEGVTLVSADKGVITDNKWTFTIPELKIGESLEVTLTAKVATYVAGAMVNTACVNAPEVNPNNPSADDSCDTATVTVPEPVKPEKPKPIPTTPQVLPNTGAGSVISLVTIVAVLSAVGHRLVLGRRQAE
ncbi:MAG: DUF11 domain-containing protein [Candidatus Saccharimonadales bacterium]